MNIVPKGMDVHNMDCRSIQMVGHKLKLKAIAKFLSNCISKFVGNVKMQIINATKVILRLDTAMDSWAFSPEERALRCLLKKKILCLDSLERTIAKLHSHILWLQKGDASKRMFHTHARN
jgi:hypothetical protein